MTVETLSWEEDSEVILTLNLVKQGPFDKLLFALCRVSVGSPINSSTFSFRKKHCKVIRFTNVA